jgi:GT2 family glycosyltransferase
MPAAANASISIVIATRNRASVLKETLEKTVLLNERPAVFVVDNASKDNTQAVVRSFGPPVQLIALDRNHGAAARNFGVREARTPLIALADDDSWYEPGSLRLAEKLFDERPSLGLIATRVLIGTESVLDPTCVAMAASPLPAAPGLPGPAVLGFLACGAVVRRSAFDAAGGFNEIFGVGGEEELLAIDLAVAGFELAYIDRVVVHHHPTRPESGAARRSAIVRNALWCAAMRRRLPGLLHRVSRIGLNAGRDRPGWAGIRDAFCGISNALRSRKAISRELDRRLFAID